MEKIYLVKHADTDYIDEVLAYFNSKQKAEAFLNRFKTNNKYYEIMEMPINPKFIVNKSVDSYEVLIIGKYNFPDQDHFKINNSIESADIAEKEEYTIDFPDNFPINYGVFQMTLFATSRRNALVKVVKKRDKVVTSGEWDKAYQESRASQS